MNSSPIAALVDRLADDIRAGRLAPGARLPTHRELAATHRIAIATASKVYALLKSRGLAVGETGRGTFVRDRPMAQDWDSADEARRNPAAFDMSFNHPEAAGQGDLLRAMLRDLAGGGDLASLMQQQPPGGRRHDRQVVCDFLARHRGIDVAADRLFLVNGAQQGLDVAARTWLAPGDQVAVDALSYPGFKMLGAAQRLVLKPVRCLADGPDLAALDALCRGRRIRAIYAMPTLHNPLGWVLDNAQRRQLVAIARRHDCLLIEDAAYAFLADPAPPALVTMAPERTVYVSSFSKSVATGLRVGYLIVPEAAARRAKAQIRASHWSLPSLVTTMAARWIVDGTVARLEAAQRAGARTRQVIAREVFAGMDVTANPASLFVWLRLPPELRMDRIATALADRNIAVSKAEAYATTVHAPHALRLALGSLPVAQLEPVLKQVRETIDRYPI